ncbi:large-conductance mechanosensitive channel protein MscL [Nevskia soli]|uniref:large-conductance mechanosensitive channel protein MscL n=1 Tax=Nevskia soli TaxID=418856 RepID=UPI0004A6D727|nr:large-conductance mechanosensitive channel protein MscL [Nevskia soli]
MSILKEFRDFAMKGNVVDLAVGVIIGGAFGKIVSSLVGDIFMPLLGLITGGVNFSDMAVTLRDGSADGKTPAVLLAYGKFIQNTFDFVILAFVIFLFIKAINRFKSRLDAAPAATPAQEVLLTEIRDLLKQKA